MLACGNFSGTSSLKLLETKGLYQPMQFKNVVVHPGGMHVRQSFVDCIAKLMKSSGLEVYSICRTGWYYKGNITIIIIITLTGIFNWKSWVKAMRAFRGHS